MVTIVTSPGTPRSSSLLLQAETESTVSSDITHCLWLAEQDDSTSPCLLICRGATLSATSDAERISLSTCSLVADSVILGGITLGDFQGGTAGAGGIRDSRHGRTLTALFRARIRLEGDSKNAADAAAEGDATEDSEPVAAATTTKRQTLILPLPPSDDDDEINLEALKSEIESIFLDVSIEKDGGGAPTKTFDEMYTLELMSFADAGKVRARVLSDFSWCLVRSRLRVRSSFLLEDMLSRPMYGLCSHFWHSLLSLSLGSSDHDDCVRSSVQVDET
jgi:hypothetical protein